MNDRVFVDRIVGSINTFIRMINESDVDDSIGKGIIKNEWKSAIIKEDNTFIAILEINNSKKHIYFKEHEWFGYGVVVDVDSKLDGIISEIIG